MQLIIGLSIAPHQSDGITTHALPLCAAKSAARTQHLVRSVKFIGLLHLTARPLTAPLVNVPAPIPPGKHEEQLSGRHVRYFSQILK